MNTVNSIVVSNKIEKILNDIENLEQIGLITALEIELDKDKDHLDKIITYCSGIGGLIYSLHSVYVNYPELGREGLKSFLWELSMNSEIEIIEGILVHMQMANQFDKISLSVEIDLDTSLPRMISTSDKSRYYEIFEHFKLSWYLISNSMTN